MTHILLENYHIDSDLLYPALKPCLRPSDRVAVIAFAFRDTRVRSVADWNALYGRENGRFYGGIVQSFARYGIPESSITFVNYFSDTRQTAALKIREADIVYFPGGLPDRMMERIQKFGLDRLLASHTGVMMGYSAGAVIQLAEYHLSPDEDYPSFSHYRGLPCLNGFYLEVHYEQTPAQTESIRRVLTERKMPVYALYRDAGALIVDQGTVRPLGRVKVFSPGEEFEN